MGKWQTGSAFLAALGLTTGSLAPLAIHTPALARTTFEDVQGHWAQLCIERLAQQGVVTGYLDGTFRPNALMSRGEFATIVAQAFFSAPAVGNDVPFFDVPTRTRTGTAVRTARQTGFLDGFPSGVFQPNEPLTRVQAIVSLANGLNLAPTNFAVSELGLVYDDAKSIPNYALNSVVAATERGLIVNYPEIRFLQPNQPATRAEVAAFVCQALASAGKASPVAQQYVVAPPSSGGIQTNVQTSPNGQVRAQLTYQKENYVYSNLSVRVERAGQTLLDTPLPIGSGVSSSLAFRLVDLDGDTEPELLIDLFPRGEGCCTYSLIYRYLPASGQYTYLQQPWGYAGYNLRDFNQDGVPEFESQDPRFGLQFASTYEEAAAPIQIWQYRQGQMFDVTRQYPTLVANNSNKLLQDYEDRLSQGQDVRPVLAAYLANQFLLGQGRQAWSDVQSNYGGSDRTQYLENLRGFLRSIGYSN
ncbi:MAG: S-layer homology domain-containing protein [Microcoleus vaginatus WJT46-NPBG5]|nr:S-layer homology domain-containing protein [Microcoleus vaginatus WJT46-NPBG5]